MTDMYAGLDTAASSAGGEGEGLPYPGTEPEAPGPTEATSSADSHPRQTFASSAMRWGACRPVSMNASVWWSYGSEDDSQSQCPVESRAGTDQGPDQTQDFYSYMAPNYNCWEMEDARYIQRPHPPNHPTNAPHEHAPHVGCACTRHADGMSV